MSKYNWSNIRNRYIKSPVKIGIRELASIYKIKSHALVLRMAERDQWDYLRDQYWTKKLGKIVTKKEPEIVTKMEEIEKTDEIIQNSIEIIPESDQIVEPEPVKEPEISDQADKPKKPVLSREDKVYAIHVESKLNRAALANNIIKNAMLEMNLWFEKNNGMPFPEDKLLKIAGYLRHADTILNNITGNFPNNNTVNQINFLTQNNTQINNTVIDAKSDEEHVLEILDEVSKGKQKLIE